MSFRAYRDKKNYNINYQAEAKKVISEESLALAKLSEHIPEDFSKVVECILTLKGRVILSGMGKSGYIARKIAASLASTGTPSFFIHPAEASHGDLGMITDADLVIMLSNSGETKELADTINYCKRYHIKIVGITMKPSSSLGRNSDFLLTLPQHEEASIISAPTTSALMMLALGDALVVSLHEAKGFTSHDFKIFHPGGKLGSNLLKVSDLMYQNDNLPLVKIDDNFTNIIMIISEKRLGCAVVVDDNMIMLGIITDKDLRQHINKKLDSINAKNIMTISPISISSDHLASEALYLMNNRSIDVLPVCQNEKVVGVIHIHDILRAGVS